MPLDFVRQPEPRNCEDYIAVRKHGALQVKFGIWKAVDAGRANFGLTINGDIPQPVTQWWNARYRGHCGIVWLRTKRNCEKVANEIGDMIEHEWRDSVANRVGKL